MPTASRAFAAAKKAVELDPQSSEAHASLAFVTFWGRWDVADAEKEFRRAIELDPNNAKAHHWFATYLQALHRDDEGLGEINIARKLDPGSSSIMADQGELLRCAGRRDQSLRLLQQLEAAQPDFISAHRYLRLLYFDQRDFPNFIAEWKKEALLTRDPVVTAEADTAAKGFARGGPQAMFQALLPLQQQLYKQGKLSPYFVAITANQLDKRDLALRYLSFAIQAHDSFPLFLASDPDFVNLHGDPAFEQLAAKITAQRGK